MNTAGSEVRVKSGLSFTRFAGSRRAVRKRMRELLKSKRRDREKAEGSIQEVQPVPDVVEEEDVDIADEVENSEQESIEEASTEEESSEGESSEGENSEGESDEEMSDEEYDEEEPNEGGSDEEDRDEEDNFEDMEAIMMELPPVHTGREDGDKSQDSDEEEDDGTLDEPLSLPPLLPPLSDVSDFSNSPSHSVASNPPADPPKWNKKRERIVYPHGRSIVKYPLVSTFPLILRPERERTTPRIKLSDTTKRLNRKLNRRHPRTGEDIRRRMDRGTCDRRLDSSEDSA